ncbi:hypothetical protein [Nocardia aurea]|uniref:hypothetical protein n=1 Tax=Nocardia aurea TaxID=2144174 RepID=UPI000D6967DC|nr:hypothetical protein [Nocardia aurea]
MRPWALVDGTDWTCQIIADEARTLHKNGKWADSDTASGNLELIPARWIGANSVPNAGVSSLPEAALTKLVDTPHRLPDHTNTTV